MKLTRDSIERMAEWAMDTLDWQLMNNQLTQDEYNEKCMQLDKWEVSQLHALNEQNRRKA